MKRDSILGRTLRFKFSDGPMAKTSIDHTFDREGGVSWTIGGKSTKARACKTEAIRKDFRVISYLSDSGHTLTLILDFDNGTLLAISSNEAELGLSHGIFEDVTEEDPAYPPSSRATLKRSAPHHSLR